MQFFKVTLCYIQYHQMIKINLITSSFKNAIYLYIMTTCLNCERGGVTDIICNLARRKTSLALMEMPVLH